jgi:hypothetical protein
MNRSARQLSRFSSASLGSAPPYASTCSRKGLQEYSACRKASHNVLHLSYLRTWIQTVRMCSTEGAVHASCSASALSEQCRVCMESAAAA